jgi:hypothetical protein
MPFCAPRLYVRWALSSILESPDVLPVLELSRSLVLHGAIRASPPFSLQASGITVDLYTCTEDVSIPMYCLRTLLSRRRATAPPPCLPALRISRCGAACGAVLMPSWPCPSQSYVKNDLLVLSALSVASVEGLSRGRRRFAHCVMSSG